jgi:hypothetical protein
MVGQESCKFSSTAEFFQYIASQTLKHLHQQPNSVDNAWDAERKLRLCYLFQELIPQFTNHEFDKGPFKLFCDDLQFGNILVNNNQELQFVAVLDWEWSYAAPYQLLYSPYRCLLLSRPNDWDEDEDGYLEQFSQNLECFHRILEEEETSMGAWNGSSPRLSFLMKRSWEDGTFWFHEIAFTIFGGSDDLAWRRLQDIFPDITHRLSLARPDEEDFVLQKMRDLSLYGLQLQTMNLGKSSSCNNGVSSKTRKKTGH